MMATPAGMPEIRRYKNLRWLTGRAPLTRFQWLTGRLANLSWPIVKATAQGIARRAQAQSRCLYMPIPVWAGLERSCMR
jgi:hypothetical protein